MNEKEKKKDQPVLDELAQETRKVVLGEKVVESRLPALCRLAGAEGAVLLKNDNAALPLSTQEPVAVFGRVQVDWFYVGYGSGGDVNPPYTVNLMDGLRDAGVPVDQELAGLYAKWSEENVPDPGFWGNWPRYFEEMPLEDSQVQAAASRCRTALLVIGRAAGESRENALEPGSYYLTEDERKLLSQVTAAFEKTVVLLDIGSVMDLSWLEQYPIHSALLVWQGGMESGHAAADVLTGKVDACGRLTDTIAYRYEDYPSAKDFLGEDYNNYTEDIFVGYRYFETFQPDVVQFPFGYGLSYTTFETSGASVEAQGDTYILRAQVKNTGSRPGRDVLQVYVQAPQGKLGKASRVLVGFEKTRLLQPGESQSLEIAFPLYAAASFDDSGATGWPSAWVAEAGEYLVYAGANVRQAPQVGSFALPELRVIQRLQEVCPPDPAHGFDRMVNRDGQKAFEPLPAPTRSLKDRVVQNLPQPIPYTGDRGITFQEVAAGSASLDDFIAQLTVEDLSALSRGDLIMDSPLGAKGNAGAMVGVTQRLRDLGVPPVITTDGPSGIRLQFYCSLMPNGTSLACTWDPDLVSRLYQCVGREMKQKGTHILLGPGMNIHRNPLCGRNFEYFSEDPLVTGKTAAAFVRGLQKSGVSACPKHFACNNQETNRNYNDSRVSQRALREIYLKGFEICVKEAAPHTIMSSYNKVNGVWSHYNYDLCTTVLRGEWGYEGCVMTDWWMRPSPDPDFPDVWDSAYRIRAQVDVLMPGARPSAGFPPATDADPAPEESCARENGLTLGELQRGAKNVLRLALASGANPFQ